MAGPMTGERRVDLFEGRDARGTRAISATLRADGTLIIDGQDLGPQVQIFGPDFREYEWAWTAQPAEVPRIVEALGGKPGDDPLQVLTDWSRGRNGEDPGNYLKKAGITLEFWSRIGD